MKRIITEKTNKFYGFIHSTHDIISVGTTSIVIKIKNDLNYNSYFLVAYKSFKENKDFFYIDSQKVFDYNVNTNKFEIDYWKGFSVNNKIDHEIFEISENAIKIIDKCNDYLFFSADKDRIMRFNF